MDVLRGKRLAVTWPPPMIWPSLAPTTDEARLQMARNGWDLGKYRPMAMQIQMDMPVCRLADRLTPPDRLSSGSEWSIGRSDAISGFAS